MSRQLTIEQARAMQEADAHQRGGRPAEAEAIYRHQLESDPDQPQILHRMAVLAFDSGSAMAALGWIGRAIASDPVVPQYHCDHGHLLLATGHADEAAAAFGKSLELDPNLADAHAGIGNVMQVRRRFDDAIGAYRTALAKDPQLPLVWNNLGNALREKQRLGEAEEALRHAIALRPNFPAAHYNLGLILHHTGRIEDAIASCRRAVELQPAYPQAWSQLGISLQQSGRLDEAISAFRQAIAIRNDFGEAHNNLGKALRAAGQVEHSLRAYQQAVMLRPDLASIHFNYGTTLLLSGDFHQGLAEFEWRLQVPEFQPYLCHFVHLHWDGSALNGKRILLHTEQGFGDAIQFVRYVPFVAARGGKVILHCQPELVRLFENMSGVQQVVARDQPLPEFDVHCSLMSLPLLFRTSLLTIPAPQPYLLADAELADIWEQKLPVRSKLRRVGLVWAGQPNKPGDEYRSIPFSRLTPLSRVPGVWLCSLQKGPAAAQAPSPWTDLLNDFADTAALIQNLDLVITVDTAVAHLAGAIGKPVWVLLPFAPDWRWMLRRRDSPWYPTMRLFRQPRIGDWETPIARVAQALNAFCASEPVS